MNEIRVGDLVFAESFKHDGSLHRVWSKTFVIDETPDYWVVVTDHSWVVEADGRRWLTKEPAVCFFYKERWFNVISMVRKSGIYYYCNLATPSLYDGEAIKNIDYDLDVKVFPDGSYMILDENEYEYHCQLMNYPETIKTKLAAEMKELLKMIEAKEKPFDFTYVKDYLMTYFKLQCRKEKNA